MRVEDNIISAAQTPVNNPVSRESTPGASGAMAAEQTEIPWQQSTLGALSVVGILKQYGVVISFSLDGTDNFVFKVVNPFTGQVIKEIPPAEIVTLAASLEQVSGVLIDKKA
jgi:uncharacterized FlaG/YvyC family protein